MKLTVNYALDFVMDVITKGNSPVLITPTSSNKPKVMSCQVQSCGNRKFIKIYDNKDKIVGNFMEKNNYVVKNNKRTNCCEKDEITNKSSAFELVFYSGTGVAQFKLLWQ